MSSSVQFDLFDMDARELDARGRPREAT